MKLIEKIAYITFWINIFFVLFIFIGMPVILVKIPGSFDLLTLNKGLNPYNLTFSFLNLGVVFHWGYCIWFWYKNDKYSLSIIPLFFLTGLYAPIYYYRVKIKKRPLRNKLKNREQKKQEDKVINEREFIELTRENIISVLQLWTSKEKQLEYQKSFQETQVSSDLFEQWNDFYTPTAEVMKQAFDKNELDLLKKFDKIITEKAKDLNNSIPDLNEFIETSEWKELNSLSRKILTDLK
jgi:hypothetical protein